MEQRYTFQCCECNRTYTLLRETISYRQTVQVACPFCHQEAVVDFAPLLKKTKQVMRGQQPESDEALDLPAVLPTRKPD